MAELPAPKEIALSATPSLIYNNLCTVGDSFLYAHQHDLIAVKPLGAHKIPLHERDRAQITSVGTAKFNNRTIYLLTTNTDTQMWDVVREVQLAVVSHGAEEETRGIAASDIGASLLLAIGHGNGEVEFASVGSDFSVQIVNRQKAHRHAVTAITSSTNAICAFASGDTGGEVQLWNAQLQAYCSIPVNADCVSGIAIISGWVAAAYGSGTIRLFNALTGHIRFDIGAHSRWITGMAFSLTKNLLATVSEDNLVCVFRLLPSDTAPKAEFVGYKVHSNRLPTGVAFTEDGQSIVVSVYDSDKLLSYPSPA